MKIESDAEGFDIIGDIHGYADQLERLLDLLGFCEIGGAYRHAKRKAIFVGDLIDRGPKQVEAYRLVRAMCEAGSAQCVIGNHEFNAIGWVTTDAGGEPLRRHSVANQRQHGTFLQQVGGEGSELHLEIIAWCKTLPVWIETDHIRVVHACWHPESQLALDEHLDAGRRFTGPGLSAALTRGTKAYQAAEMMLKGPELTLPNGLSFPDVEGTMRTTARIKWWSPAATTYRAAAILNPETSQQLPLTEPADAVFRYQDSKPVFFGHYWLSGQPVLECASAMCLDYSIARGGALVAYRWSGERALTAHKIYTIR